MAAVGRAVPAWRISRGRRLRMRSRMCTTRAACRAIRGETRTCLPSCGGDGYQVVAQVSWTISFAASGPVAGSGGLPARTTESDLVYPVSEARAFLVGGSS